MRRNITAVTSAVAVATAAVVVPTQIASAKDQELKTTKYPQTCYAVPYETKLAPPKTNTGQFVTVEVTSNSTVQVGKYVRAKMKVLPDKSIVKDLPLGAKVTNNARIKADYQLPDGMELVSATLKTLPDTDVSGLSVYRVNEDGKKDDNGRILRIASADNATVGNSPNARKDGAGNANYVVNNNRISWHLPELTLTFKAEKVGTWSFGTRHKNGADGANENDKAYITFNAVTTAPVIGTVYAPTYCTPRRDPGSPIDDGAKNLFTWTVTDKPQKKVAEDTSVSINTTRVDAGIINDVVASVSPSTAEGTVEFYIDGEIVGSGPVKDGAATGKVHFENLGKIALEAKFIPSNAKDFKPSETTATVESGPTTADFKLVVSPSAVQDSTVTASTTSIGTGAKGTVTFTLEGASPVTAKVEQGAATARIPVGKKLGSRKITAEFKAAAGSLITDGNSEAEIEVTENTSTSLTLEGPTKVVNPGESVKFTATVIPKKDSSDNTSGTIAFTAGAVTKQVPVTNGTATAEMIIDQSGLNPVSAEYYPDKGSDQTNATAETAVTAAVRETTTLNTTAPPNLKPFTPTPMQVVVATASGAPAEGTVIARVHGRTTKAKLSNGRAVVDITVTSTGETPVEVSYVPDKDSPLPPISDIVPVTATDDESGEGALNIALVEAAIPAEADADKPVAIDVTVKNGETDSTEGVNGYLVVTINNKALQESGQPGKIPVVNGKAGFDLTFKGGGQQPVQIDFFDVSGNSLGSQSYSINIKGGIINKPAEGAHANGGFFSKIIEFFTNLFAGGDAGSSAGSSSGDNKESGQSAANSETDDK